MSNLTCDVLIVGSGIIGATYARYLRDLEKQTGSHRKVVKIIMIDIGDQETPNPGAHKKNNMVYQKDIDQFVHVIKSNLSPVSLPTVEDHAPQSIGDDREFEHPLVPTSGNPGQRADRNLPGQAVTRTVGGMGTHWTCSIPRFVGSEIPQLDEDPVTNTQEWDRLYQIAEEYIKLAREDQFADSKRQQMLLRELQGNGAMPLRLACDRNKSTGFVDWSSAYSVFKFERVDDRFILMPNTRCNSLKYDATSKTITNASVTDLMTKQQFHITATKAYVIAAGAVATPQIIYASHKADQDNFHLPANLGKYITEQPLAFCQTVVYGRLREGIHPRDPEPQVMIPFDDSPEVDRPWHCQIHRDAFSYGKIPDNIHKEYIIDFRWFGRTKPRKENSLFFSGIHDDAFGMPQPTFHYTISETDEEPNRMMNHMCSISNKIGRYLPGAGPQYMEPGLALHLAGTHRAGLVRDKATTVVNNNSQVWDIPNLYLAGVGVIPTAFASNPTLTAMAYAIKSAEYIGTLFQASPA